jgi:hypothetical protein
VIESATRWLALSKLPQPAAAVQAAAARTRRKARVEIAGMGEPVAI